jgi:hypothetical protein
MRLRQSTARHAPPGIDPSDHINPKQPEAKQTNPNQTKPNQTKPNHTTPHHTAPPGSEFGNTLRGNLGLLVTPKTAGARLGSDREGANGDLSVFWITNPNNTFEGARAKRGRRRRPQGVSSAWARRQTC